MEKLDDLDKDILRIIIKNARIPFAEVADSCGVSRAAIHQRVQKLFDTGVLEGSGYTVNEKKLGFQTCTYIGIRLERGSMYKTVAEELKKLPEVTECHFTTGPYTMLIKLYAHDNDHLMELINDKIQQIEGIVSTETMISLNKTIERKIPIF